MRVSFCLSCSTVSSMVDKKGLDCAKRPCIFTTTQSLTENFGPNGRIGRRAQKRPSNTYLKKIELLWKVDQKTKVVHYFDNSNRIFFFEAKISEAWLKIRSKVGRHTEGATCQHQIGLCPRVKLKHT